MERGQLTGSQAVLQLKDWWASPPMNRGAPTPGSIPPENVNATGVVAIAWIMDICEGAIMIDGVNWGKAKARIGENEVDVEVSIYWVHNTIDGRRGLQGILRSAAWPPTKLNFEGPVQLELPDGRVLSVRLMNRHYSVSQEKGVFAMDATFLEASQVKE